MSANRFGERFLGRDKPAWDHIGKTFSGEITAVQAVKDSGLDYRVEVCSMLANVESVFGSAALPVVGRKAIIRDATQDDPQLRVLGVAGDDYKVIQNTELAELLDRFIPGYVVETVGALGVGETVFYCLRFPQDAEISGDQIKQYFLITDTKDGKTALRMAFTPVRVVCQNTLIAGLSQATVKVALTHGTSIFDDVNFRLGLLGKLNNAQTTTLNTFQQLAEIAIKMPSVDKILEAAYPLPGKPGKVDLLSENPELFEGQDEIKDSLSAVNNQWLYYCKLAQTRREETKNRLEKLNDEFPKIARTPWAVWQACVENEDFRDGPESMYASAIFGDRAKTKIRAFNKCLEYIK
jgi:phage/plasmid-like protein (TIGR03299 family)